MKTLKSIIIIFLIFVSGAKGYSQVFEDWTIPEPFTDSLSDNKNPYLFYYYPDWVSGEGLYLIWEKSFDSISTSIWLDNILDNLPAQEIISDSGIKYTNPKIMAANFEAFHDSLFFIFYETNQNGNIDIYHLGYLPDNSISSPEPFATTDFNDIQFDLGNWDLYKQKYIPLNIVTWTSNGNLYARCLQDYGGSVYFAEPLLIDNSDCSNPIIGARDKVYYLKNDNQETHIYSSQYGSSGWGAPQLYYDEADCRNLSCNQAYSSLCWSANIDGFWKILTGDYSYIHTYDITDMNPFDPSILGIDFGVTDTEFIAIPFLENNVEEIFLNDFPSSSNFNNLSNSSTTNQNPKFYTGQWTGMYYWYEYLFWESLRNDNWQIWYSKLLMCLISVDEDNNNAPSLRISPNPFINNLVISIDLKTRSNVVIDVYNNQGMHISTIANKTFNQGTHQLRWDGNGVAAGVFIIKIMVGNMVYTEKVVKE